MSTFPLRFSDPRTREQLRLVAKHLDISMNRLVEEMVQRELSVISAGIESELEDTLRRLQNLRRADIERSLDEWGASEGQPDPIVARMHIADEDPFGIAAAFAR